MRPVSRPGTVRVFNSPALLRPALGLHVLPTPLVPTDPSPPPITGGLSSPRASPTDACLPVGVEHKLDVAAAAGTLLCVIARVLTATVTIVARHCAERAGGLSACFSLGTTVLQSSVTWPSCRAASPLLPFPPTSCC